MTIIYRVPTCQARCCFNMVEAWDDEKQVRVGKLSWVPENSPEWNDKDRDLMIGYIQVDRPYRRQGIATGMLRFAQSIHPGIRHSDHRTYQGSLWAASTGDPIPACSGNYYQSRFRGPDNEAIVFGNDWRPSGYPAVYWRYDAEAAFGVPLEEQAIVKDRPWEYS